MIAKTFIQLVDEIRKRFPVGQSTDTSRSVTGEPYVVIGAQKNGVPKIAGTRDEGSDGEWAFDEETACMQAAACFETYADGRSGVLYWRTEPILESEKNRCVVYMRCLISDKPALGN